GRRSTRADSRPDGGEHVPRPDRGQRASVRHRVARCRQARAHRVPQDALAGHDSLRAVSLVWEQMDDGRRPALDGDAGDEQETIMTGHDRRWTGALVVLLVALLAGCGKEQAGHVLDEASRAGRSAESFPAADEDYFHDMDGGGALAREEVQGRNTWIVWTG